MHGTCRRRRLCADPEPPQRFPSAFSIRRNYPSARAALGTQLLHTVTKRLITATLGELRSCTRVGLEFAGVARLDDRSRAAAGANDLRGGDIPARVRVR